METKDIEQRITPKFLSEHFEDMGFMEPGTGFEKKIPNVGTVFCQRWRKTDTWILSFYAGEDKRNTVFIETISEFWTAVALFHVKQHLSKT